MMMCVWFAITLISDDWNILKCCSADWVSVIWCWSLIETPSKIVTLRKNDFCVKDISECEVYKMLTQNMYNFRMGYPLFYLSPHSGATQTHPVDFPLGSSGYLPLTPPYEFPSYGFTAHEESMRSTGETFYPQFPTPPLSVSPRTQGPNIRTTSVIVRVDDHRGSDAKSSDTEDDAVCKWEQCNK